MKRMIRSATNSCGMAARPVTSSDEDWEAYSTDEWDWIATKDVRDADGFLTDYSLYRNNDTGLFVTVFGDRDLYGPEDGEYDYETEDFHDAMNWFDSYTGFDDEDYDILSATKITANRADRYFGEIASKKYGDMICEQLGEGFKISKRKDKGKEPGGLVYEAQQLGIDMWDLLETLEGMCYDGRAREIDDSTYEIISGAPREVKRTFGFY